MTRIIELDTAQERYNALVAKSRMLRSAGKDAGKELASIIDRTNESLDWNNSATEFENALLSARNMLAMPRSYSLSGIRAAMESVNRLKKRWEQLAEDTDYSGAPRYCNSVSREDFDYVENLLCVKEGYMKYAYRKMVIEGDYGTNFEKYANANGADLARTFDFEKSRKPIRDIARAENYKSGKISFIESISSACNRAFNWLFRRRDAA